MIIIFHSNEKAIEAFDYTNNCIVKINTRLTIQQNLIDVSLKFKDYFLGWSHLKLKESINIKELTNILHHKKLMYSFSTTKSFIINDNIGFVDSSPFVNVKFKKNYPTWLMSSDIGFIHSLIIQKTRKLNVNSLFFEEFLCFLAKELMPKGLICKSVPALLINTPNKNFILEKKKPTNSILVNFIKNNYKKRWLLLLFLNLLIYKKKFILITLLSVYFKRKSKINSIYIADIEINSTNKRVNKSNFSVDVLIPTLGRKTYLLDVLKCLSRQTLLPKKVIIVEQNPDKTSNSELDYLIKDWPFIVDHTFIHQTGACNARNIALSKVTSDWVFFADDDILFEKDILEKSFNKINELGEECITFSCLQKGEIEKNDSVFQWKTFGSGTSIVKTTLLKGISFKKEHEFGYGEDADFGMQLRNNGTDIIYAPQIKLLHLKAPIGGFRYNHKFKWFEDKVQPKPSPTIMAYNLKHKTKEQLLGYKTILFFKFYKNQKSRNPISYINKMNLQWNASKHWAKK